MSEHGGTGADRAPAGPHPHFTFWHLDGTECVAGWHSETGECAAGGGPVTPRERRCDEDSEQQRVNYAASYRAQRGTAQDEALMGALRDRLRHLEQPRSTDQ